MFKKILLIVFLFLDIMVNAQTEKDTVHLKIEPFNFNDIPEAIDGGACYFSSSIDNFRNNEYIFVNDFASYGCIKTNGLVQLLDLSSYNMENKEFTYTGRDIVVKIRIKNVLEKNDELYSIVEFKVKSKSGSFEGILVGRCDC
jgi:hypothetical protein